MRFNPKVSVTDNMLALVNTKAKHQFLPNSLSFGNPTIITPGAGNGNKNTSIVATGTESSVQKGNVTVTYNRSTLDSTNPKLGTICPIHSDDAINFQEMKIAVCDYFKFSPEDVGITNSYSLPMPANGYETNFTITTLGTSKIHLPSSMAVTIRSMDPKPDPGFGAKVFLGADFTIPNALKFTNMITGTVLTGNWVVSDNTVPTKYGTMAMRVASAPGHLKIPLTETGGDITQDDFTIEFWYHIYGWGAAELPVFSYWGTDLAHQRILLCHNVGTAIVKFGDGLRSQAVITVPTVAVYRAWQHWAVQKRGKVISLYIDGTLAGSFTWNFASNAHVFQSLNYLVGSQYNDPVAGTVDRSCNGYFDEIIISSQAKYTTNFVPGPQGRSSYNRKRPEAYFGHPVGLFNDLPVYRVLTPGFTGTQEQFYALLNAASLCPKQTFNAETLALSELAPGSVEGQTGNYLVRFTGQAVKTDGYILHDRV